MERRQVIDDAVLWLSMLSVAAICLLMLYYGITGIVGLKDSGASPMKQAFAMSVYILFIMLPMLIVNLMLDTTFVSKLSEWSMPLIYMIIIADIFLMTVLFLLMGP